MSTSVIAIVGYPRYKQAADVTTQRLKAVTLASTTNDCAKAQTMELVPDDNVTGVYGTGDLRRVAKTVEMANKIQAAT